MTRLFFATLVILVAHVEAATVIEENARIEVRGKIERQRNQQVLRAGGQTYRLEFPNSALRNFAAGLAGDAVIVRGEFRASGSRLVIRPDYISRADSTEEASVGSRAYNVSVEEEAGAPAVIANDDNADDSSIYYDRVDSRKRDVLNRRNSRRNDTRVILTPGGGTIILNNQ